MRAVRERRAGQDRGFTIIELMVAVLIIGILIAIEIPTLLGSRQVAEDRAAQANLRQALLTAKTFYTDKQRYDATAPELHALEPSLAFDATIANAGQSVIGYTGTTADIVMEKMSPSGAWFCIADSIANGTRHGHGATQASIETVGTCSGGW